MCLSVTAVRLPGDPLTLNEPSYDPSWLYSPVFIHLYGHIAKGSSHNMHRPREVTVICVFARPYLTNNNKSYGYYC